MRCPQCGFEFDRREKKLPISEMKPGCLQIAKNIESFSTTSLFLINAGQGFRRMPYILTLLGMDEAGKVLTIMKKAIALGNVESSDSVIIENWYAHQSKGTEAGDIGVLTVDWLIEVSKRDPLLAEGDQQRDSEFMNGYRSHLQRLKDDYSGERNSMLYCNFDGSSKSWTEPDVPQSTFVLFDAVLLGLFSKIVFNYLDKGGTFLTLNDAILEVKNCTDFQDALKKLGDMTGTNLSGVFKSIEE